MGKENSPVIRERKNRRTLRSGYTTGACAAAAARAAATALTRQEIVSQVQIKLPDGSQATFHVSQCVYDHAHGACSIIKDAGDDPDVTNGAEIWATVLWQNESGIAIDGGIGVGVVTKPGLEIAVGSPAINRVPRQMIADAVNDVAGNNPTGRGLKVIISVPKGVELAKRTLNRRLGIVGGISILGTTGIVIPYSVNAYTTCISQALDMAIAAGCREVVLTTGRRSEKFAQQKLALPEECFVQAGDFIGYSLEECVRKRLTKVTLWGMTGKISKLAGGSFYTNVSDSDIDIGFLTGLARDCHVPDNVINELAKAISANHFCQVIPAEHKGRFADKLCLLAARKCRGSINGKLMVECVMTDYDGIILGSASVNE